MSRKIAKNWLAAGRPDDKDYKVTPEALLEWLGPRAYRENKREAADEIGLANGLAVTIFGGELLPTEVTVVPGKGKLTLTGKLGEVMQESAQAAMSYIRSRSESFGLARDFQTKVDIHVHFPEGAIPKDGPSAGITMATAIVSALLRIPVHQHIAMTGEITLRGRVLPIGGLKEKILAAHRAGVTTVLIPEENKKDLKDIPERVLEQIDRGPGQPHGRGPAPRPGGGRPRRVPPRAQPHRGLAGGRDPAAAWTRRQRTDPLDTSVGPV